MTLRFRDQGEYLREFMNDIRVRCPNCSTDALVRSESARWRSRRTFSCLHCAHSLGESDSRWFGPLRGIARRRCGRCGRWLEKRLQSHKRGRSKLELECPGCSALSLATCDWHRENDGTRDPHFGLPLWLQTRCCGHTLWALNQPHLTFLRGFVSAQVRERVSNRNASLVSRLPKWLKLARNRESVLKSLTSLENRLGREHKAGRSGERSL